MSNSSCLEVSIDHQRCAEFKGPQEQHAHEHNTSLIASGAQNIAFQFSHEVIKRIVGRIFSGSFTTEF